MPWGAAIGAGVGLISNLAGAGAGASNAVNSGPTDQQNALYDKQGNLIDSQIDQINRNQGYMDAIAQGESNPQFAQRVGQQEGRLRGDLIDSMKESINQNRRNIATGGPGLFANQDRRDESVSQALNKGFEGARTNAENLVKSDYATAGRGTLQGANALGAAGKEYGNLADVLGKNQQQQQANMGYGIGAIGTGLSSAGYNAAQLFGSNSNPYVVNDSNGGGQVTDYNGNLVDQTDY